MWKFVVSLVFLLYIYRYFVLIQVWSYEQRYKDLGIINDYFQGDWSGDYAIIFEETMVEAWQNSKIWK